MSLTSCSATNPIDKSDRKLIDRATIKYSKEGIAIDAAAMRAVDDLIAQLRGEKSKLDGESASVAAKASGALTALATKSLDGTPYNLRNVLADFFTQAQPKANAASARPLVTVKNLLTALKNGTVSAADFLADKARATEHSKAIDFFLDYAQEVQDMIQKNLPARRDVKYDEHRHEDLMLYLLTTDANGATDVDENIKTAISYAAYKWAIDAAGTPFRLKKQQINSILGREKGAWVSRLAYDTLGTAGAYQHLIVDSLGGSVMDALGLKAKSNAPQELTAKLRMAFGSHALKLLEDTGLATRTEVAGDVIRTMREEGLSDKQISKLGKTTTNTLHYFFALARDKEGNYAENVQSIVDANKGSQDVLGKIFKVESGVTLPSLEPITTVQATTAGTSMAVPKEQQAVILINQARPWAVRQDTMKLLDGFTEDEVLAMAGVVKNEKSTTHVNNRKAVDAKNDSLRREYANFNEYVGEYLATSTAGLGTPFYLPYSVWKQQRVGIASTAINPQTSKIHRFLVGSPEWTTEINTSDDTLMTGFFLRVVEGFGVKTERADNTVSVENIQATVAEPVYAQAIDALHKQMVKKEALTADEKASIMTAVAKGGKKMHSLDALIGLAYHKEAVDSGSGTFTVQMMGEVDGVSNGTMFNHVLLGAARNAADLNTISNKGGFYEEGHTHSEYNQWRGTAGNLDIYETTTKLVIQQISTLLKQQPTADQQQTNAELLSIWAIGGELFNAETGDVTKEGRSLVKDAMNPLAFGSSIESIGESMSATFLESVYAGFEKMAKQKTPVSQETLDAYVGHLNTLIGTQTKHIPVGLSLQAYMDASLSSKAENAIRATFAGTVGEATSSVFKEEFSVFLSRRDSLNKTAQATFDLYEAIYSGERAAYIEQLIADGGLEAMGPNGRMGDLSKKQEAELAKKVKDIAPVLRTAMSSGDSDSRKAGLFMTKSKNKQSKDSAYSNRTGFGTPMQNKNKSKSLELNGFASQQESPGVAMGSAMTHSTDSAIMIRTQAENAVLGIHDAVGGGVGGLQKAAQSLNQNTWNTLLEFSPLTEAYNSLETVVSGIASAMSDGSMSPQALTNLKAYLQKNAWKYGVKPDAMLEVMLLEAHEVALRADQVKLETMATWSSVSQYSYQGGNYEVTLANREKAANMLAELPTELSADALKAVEQLKGVMTQTAGDFKTTSVVEKAQVDETTNQAVDSTNDENDFEGYDLSGLQETKTTPFGVLGKPTAASDPDLVDFFNENPKATAKQVIEHLYSKVSARDSGGNKEFNLKLLKLLSKSVNPALSINLVTADTAEDTVLGKPASPAFGWYSTQGTDEAIYLASSDFTHSNIRTEVLMHELTHAATAYQLSTTAGKPYRAELAQLLSATQKHLSATGVTKYDAALTSVDELVAYGMTSKDFQQNVLAKVPMTGKTGLLSSALTQFVDVLSRLLGFKTTAEANGLGVLLSNVTALMAQGATERAAVGSRTLSMAAKIDAYTTLDLHEALDSNGVTPAFATQLTGLLRGMVDSLHGPFGAFKESFMSKQAGTALEVWAKAKVSGIAPFASQALMSGFPASQQEAFAMEQVEATVAAALSSKDATTKAAYKELYELYSEAYKTFKPSDFASQADYDFVFKIEQGNGGVSNYLSRFAALGLANQKFNSMLKIASDTTPRQVKTSDSFAERLQLAFQKILAMFNRKVLHVYAGQAMDEKLGYLVEQLVDIEAKRKAALSDTAWDVQLLNPMAKTSHQVTLAIRAGIGNLGGSAILQGNRLKSVGAVGNLAKILTTKGRTKAFLMAFRDMQDKYTDERMGIVSSLMQEYVGQDDRNQVLLRASKLNDGHRKDAISGFGKSVKEGFKDNGKTMSEDSRNSITPVFLRTGAHHLVDHFSLAEIETMLQSPAALQAAITKIENQLASVPLAIRADYIEKANALGMFKATGKNLDPHLLKNAHSIAKMYGTATQAKISDQQAEQAQPVIAALVALYALEYTNPEQLKHAHEALQTENQRTDGENGVEFVLAIHKDMEKESLQRLFKGNPALMTHGYTPEIYDPFVTLTPANAVDGAKLEAQGYKKGAALSVDPADPDTSQRSLYVLQGLGMTRRLTGAMAFQGKQAKGSPIHSGFTNTATTSGTNNAATNAGIAAHRAQLGNLSPTRSRVDLSKAKEVSYMAPVIDEQGNVATWAYLMQETTKDSLLHRDNRFDKVIGTLAGSILGKESGIAQNDKAILALKEQFDLDTKKSLDSYFLVGPKTNDKERQEIWNLLPYETKQTILKVWGEEGMLVRKDAMDIMFGYRKLSLTDAFNKDPVLRDAFERVVVAIARAAFGEKAALRMAQGERAWQDIVAEAKDTIVIKSGVVMLSNIKSNMWLLAMSGVPIKDILYHHLVALKGSHSYQKDSEELAQLQRLQATGYTQGKDDQIARDIARLEDSLARNPIKELMDAGLMPTIVDDVNPDDDIYSYKSGMAKAIDSKLKKVSPLVINAAKTIYMAHDTKLYQGIHRVTQLSDFVARYTLYQHLTNQKAKPLTKEEAIQEASDAFINYDIPMHRKMQYLDDMGLMMFTKYFLRIQKVLVKNLRDNPGRVVGSIMMANYLGLGQTVHQEASMWGRIGNNPFGIGAGNYFSSLDDLATISGPMALIK
jgi:hypothetical protein